MHHRLSVLKQNLIADYCNELTETPNTLSDQKYLDTHSKV
jgi:hypothetical protein